MAALGLRKSVLGIDVIAGGRLVLPDAEEEELLRFATPAARIVLTPVGGQGFVLGRGNQQLSPRVVRAIGLDRLVVVATPAKLNALGGRAAAGRHGRCRPRRGAGRLPPRRHVLRARDGAPGRVVAPSRTWRDASHESRSVTIPPQFVAFPRREHRTMFL